MLSICHGNDFELLRELAVRRLERDPPPPLVAERVVLPSAGMARWLRQGIAEHSGIAAALSCESPGQFLRALVAGRELPAAETDPWSKEQLGLRILGLLPGLLDRPEFAPLVGYLADTRDPRRALALAERLGTLFDQYLLYRPDWIFAWENERSAAGEPERSAPWQPLLWRALHDAIALQYPDAPHGAAAAGRLLRSLRGENSIAGLPARVTGFGLGTIPPPLLAVLEVLGACTDVCLFQFDPCREYWIDGLDERTLARLARRGRAGGTERGHTLLSSWGQSGREQLRLLLENTQANFLDCFVDRERDCLLHCLQADVLELAEAPWPEGIARDDHSIVFAETHSPLREVEALHDALLELFDRLPALEPREIVVMAPDIGLYATHVQAVFGAPRDPTHRIPFTIADRAGTADSPLATAFLHLLEMPASRFTLGEVFALLAVPALAHQAGLDEADVESLRTLAEDAGVRQGYDGAASAGSGPALERNTWRFGLERLLLGIALEEETLFEGIAPLTGDGAGSAVRIGQLAAFVDRLAAWSQRLGSARTAAAWREELGALLDTFVSREPQWAVDRGMLDQALAAQFDALDTADFAGSLAREEITELLARRLGKADTAHAFLRGGISFCQLTPLRSVPFRVVCMLGLNAGAFPRQQVRAGFDLMAVEHRAGDPSRRDDDRFLFLEAVLSARDCLYLSRVARDERNDTALEASVPLSELRDYLDARAGAGTARALTRTHRLKPFHPDYFSGEGSLFSYRGEWLVAPDTTHLEAAFCPERLPERIAAPPALHDLVGFVRNPSASFLERRFGVRFEEQDTTTAEEEPFALDGLDTWALRDALAAAQLAGEDAASRLLATGTLPHGAAGHDLLTRENARVADLVRRAREWHGLAPESVAIAVPLAAGTLRGTLSGLREGALRERSASRKASGATLLGLWVRHLAGCAAGCLAGPSTLDDLDARRTLPLLETADARALLDDLLALRTAGLCRPLPVFPGASLAWANARLLKNKSVGDAATAAERAFLGDDYSRGDFADAHVRRLFPDAQDGLGEEFRALAERLCGPLLRALDAPAP